MRYVGRRVSDTQPLRSVPMIRTVASVFGPPPADRARAALAYAESNLAGYVACYATACATLSAANRRPALYVGGTPGCRAWHQGQAMRSINAARKDLRAAQRAVVDAAARVATLTPADEFACGHLAQMAAARATGQSLAA